MLCTLRLQVSCNDFDLVWEVDSCYQLEKLATLYKVGGGVVLPRWYCWW